MLKHTSYAYLCCCSCFLLAVVGMAAWDGPGGSIHVAVGGWGVHPCRCWGCDDVRSWESTVYWVRLYGHPRLFDM
jgi:hypothetical protein